MPSLIMTVEGCDRRFYPLGKATLLIGRTEHADIQLPSELVAGNHASIILENGIFVLHDNGSENGSFVNGRRVHRHPLRHLDLVRFGDYLFLVDLQDVIASGKHSTPRIRDVNIEPPKVRAVPTTNHGISIKLTKAVSANPKKDTGTLSKIMLDSL